MMKAPFDKPNRPRLVLSNIFNRRIHQLLILTLDFLMLDIEKPRWQMIQTKTNLLK